MNNFGISVIICVYNGSKRIKPTLKAIAEQNIPFDLLCELLIVDNASSDSTAEVVASYLNSINISIPYRIIHEAKQGKSNALVTGYNNAIYELMLICDDDNWLQPDYLKTVAEIYSKNPEIGLLGGYGKAFFEPGEKPEWFDKYEQYYVCGKHHKMNGFLNPLDYRIWGAGSVLRKRMWEFIRSNGFNFYHGLHGRKLRAEDVELSMAITFTGHCLYFDDSLWFTHDLRDSRVTWNNFLLQEELNGKSKCALCMYKLSYKNSSCGRAIPFTFLFIKQLLIFSVGFVFYLIIKREDRAASNYYFSAIKELAFHFRRYKKLFSDSSDWIIRIKNKYPLTS